MQSEADLTRTLMTGEFDSELAAVSDEKADEEGFGNRTEDTPHSNQSWPEPLEPDALIGLAGEFVRLVAPHTEADEAAILLQFLAGVGVAFGRSAHFAVEADRHFGNLFVVLVGATAKGRKGTSWGQVREVLRQVDEKLHNERIESGLASGEGLIWSVRDAIGEEDPGESDKRLLVVEPEFARVLSVSEREGNTLSAVIRQAWDEGNLRTLTKKQAARSTDAHIGIIGHITKDELRRLLSSTAAGNGFANRFLWVCVKRSKLLPDGGSLNPVDMEAFAANLRRIVAVAQSMQRLDRDKAARATWHSVYAGLSEGKPGLLGAVTSRSEAQVVRLSLLYALLDGCATIRAEHVLAGLAVWDYCERSARFIFGDALGDATADEIRLALQNAGAEGLTRTELREYFGRHKPSGEIGRALALLDECGAAFRKIEPTGGRPVERWFHVAR